MPTSNLDLLIDRKDFGRTRLADGPLAELQAGAVRFRVERYALTANNVTYASFGDALGYWDFFPAENGWGRVPAMGYAEVIESAHPDVAVGGRYFGWFPMSRYVDVEVAPTAGGLRDEGAHRAAHASIYRRFAAVEHDRFYAAGEDEEDRRALLRVLFLTSFLADDALAERDYHGATRVVVLSASSKTAIGFAERATARGLEEIIGLTSPANTAFTAGLGCYHRSVPYEEIEQIPRGGGVVCVDLAGNGDVLARVHAHFAGDLRHSMAIGRSHHDGPTQPQALAGPRPEFLFAPARIEKRIQDWGVQGFEERSAQALDDFIAASRAWLQIHRSAGAGSAQARWSELLAGRVPPSAGLVTSMHDEPEETIR